MAEFTNPITDVVSTLANLVSQTYNVATDPIFGWEPLYEFSYDTFPEDLGASYHGHWMTLTAYTSDRVGTVATGPAAGSLGGTFTAPSHASYTAALFIPGGSSSGSSGIAYMDRHEYADIKLSNIIGDTVGVAAQNLGGQFRRAINPAVQVLYRSTKLREFEFNFFFAPSTEEESKSLQSIVKNIRRFAAPLRSGNGLFYITPAEWELKFYFHGEENLAIPKVRRCALTDITVDYSPQGEWSTFKNGYPVSCLMTLRFAEMEIIHRNFVEQGY